MHYLGPALQLMHLSYTIFRTICLRIDLVCYVITMGMYLKHFFYISERHRQAGEKEAHSRQDNRIIRQQVDNGATGRG